VSSKQPQYPLQSASLLQNGSWLQKEFCQHWQLASLSWSQ